MLTSDPIGSPAAIMPVDLLTEPESTIFGDSFLTVDDFNFDMETDGVDTFLRADMSRDPDDLELPSLLSNLDAALEFGNFETLALLPDLDAVPCDAFDAFNSRSPVVKMEPASPNASPSPPSPHGSDSSSELWNPHKPDLKTEWVVPDTPPITPPQMRGVSDGSPPTTPKYEETDERLERHSPPVQILSSVFVPKVACKDTPRVAAVPNPPKVVADTDRPIVLTAEEFAKLTSQGLLKFEPAPIVRVDPTPLLPKPTTRKDVDLKAMKRQQRMIKNRESACLSRKKKKEYVTQLESRVQSLTSDNVRLQTENVALKQRLAVLEHENENLKKGGRLPNGKKTTAVLAILLMLSFNLGPLTGIFLGNTTRIKRIQDTMVPRHGRSLLWTDEKNETSPTWTETANTSKEFESFGDVRNASEDRSRCPVFVNKTESLRMHRDLRGWVFNTEKESSERRKAKVRKKTLPPIPRLRGLLSKQVELDNDYRAAYEGKDLQWFNYPTYDDFLKAIEHEVGRFYVVSLRRDYLLFPALFHNKTRRPIMSLVLPAMALNETTQTPKDQVAMMRIDCEVTDTKLVLVNEDLIRPHLRKNDDYVQTPNRKTHRPPPTARHKPAIVRNATRATQASDSTPNRTLDESIT